MAPAATVAAGQTFFFNLKVRWGLLAGAGGSPRGSLRRPARLPASLTAALPARRTAPALVACNALPPAPTPRPQASVSGGTATGVVVTDTLPQGVTYVSASEGCAHDGGTVTCSLPDLVDGVERAVAISVTAVEGDYDNTATLTAEGAQAAEGQASVTVQVWRAGGRGVEGGGMVLGRGKQGWHML